MIDSNTSECKGPFTVQCEGRIELPEDDPIYGTFWIGYRVDIGTSDQLSDAMAAAEHCVSTSSFALRREFAAELVHILDAQEHLVLGGSARDRKVQWYVPAMSEAESAPLQAEIQRLRGEASFERGWDNYSTAKGLEAQADRIKARIIHPAWRAEVTKVLHSRSNQQASIGDDCNSIYLYRFEDLSAELTQLVIADAREDADSTRLPQTIFRRPGVNCWSHAESTNPFVQENTQAHFTVLPEKYLVGTVECDEECLVD